MNREIKFRVYDKATDEMYYVGDLAQLVFGMLGQEWSLWSIEGLICDDNDAVLMQYTGLKDKNGREVYEGDLVKIIALCALNEVHEVVFKCGGFMAGDGFLDDYWNLKGYMFEVIGNKFENPELQVGDGS